MGNFTGYIEGQKISIEIGDITKKCCDAYIVPQFSSCMSEEGVGGAMLRSGARQGMEAYREHLDNHGGALEFGGACVTASGGGNSRYLLHVASVGSRTEEEFTTVQKSVYNALSQAHKRGIKTIAVPALGTGILGKLTASQSAKAMMSAIGKIVNDGVKFDNINFIIYGSVSAEDEFIDVLRNKRYESLAPQIGQKEFDFDAWAAKRQIYDYSKRLLE